MEWKWILIAWGSAVGIQLVICLGLVGVMTKEELKLIIGIIVLCMTACVLACILFVFDIEALLCLLSRVISFLLCQILLACLLFRSDYRIRDHSMCNRSRPLCCAQWIGIWAYFAWVSECVYAFFGLVWNLFQTNVVGEFH